MFTSSISRNVVLLLALTACGCQNHPTDQGTSAAEPASPSSYRLNEARSLDIYNASVPEEGLLCAGQIKQEQFEALAKSGYKTFINLRRPTESGTGWESDFAESIGVDYVNIPVAGAAGITESNARRVADALDGAKRPAVLYCGSSNRVGAIYGLRAFYTQGKSPMESLEAARSAGVRSLAPKLKELLGL